MKSKTLPPLILLLLILPLTSYTQTPPESPGGQNSAYGIEPEKLYPGSMVLEILAAAETEIDAAVAEAYSEGYKAAAMRFAPELESFKVRLEAAQNQKRTSVTDRLLFGFGGFTLGVLSVGIYNLVPK